MRTLFRLGVVPVGLLLSTGLPPIEARVLRVPAEYTTIRSAVEAARDGDTVLVGRGLYVETSIAVTKRLRIEAAVRYASVIYGPERGRFQGPPVFSVSADVEIDGFVIKNGFRGIVVRSEADARLRARHLVIMNMADAGISVDARLGNTGEAEISDVVVDRCRAGFTTNDARGIDAERCLISNCQVAFAGFDHLYFRVARTELWNCGAAVHSGDLPIPAPPATNKIELLTAGKSARAAKAAMSSPETVPPGLADARRYNILGNACLATNEADKAAACFRKAIGLSGSSTAERAELLWEAQYGLGRALEARGDPEGALSRFRLAIEAVRVLVRELPPRADRGDFLLDKLPAFEDLIGSLLRAPAGHETEAFLCAENARTSRFLEFLHVPGSELGSRLDPGLRLRERAAREALSRAQIGLQGEDLSPGKARALREQLAAAETEYQDILTRIHRSSPASMTLTGLDARSLNRIRSGLLDEKTILVEYFAGSRHSYGFCLSQKGLAVVPLPPAGELDPLVRRYLKLLKYDDGGGFHGFRGGHRLFDLLLGPFAAELTRARRIIIVPDGELFRLPFEALVSREGPSGLGRFLVEDLEVSYAPSAACLLELSRRAPGRPFSADLLAVACEGPSRPREGISPLVHAGREARNIAALFPPGRRKVLSGRGATEAAVKGAAVRGTRFIHFAAHGIIDPERWSRSAILLESDPSSREDGLLQPADISTLDLDAEMVVLSACRTAQGKLVRGEGVLGLSATFLAAGAWSVVSSLWEVSDKSASVLMKSLYSGLAAGEDGARALRRAKLEAMASHDRHPRHWAAFVLNGAGGYSPARPGAIANEP